MSMSYRQLNDHVELIKATHCTDTVVLIVKQQHIITLTAVCDRT